MSISQIPRQSFWCKQRVEWGALSYHVWPSYSCHKDLDNARSSCSSSDLSWRGTVSFKVAPPSPFDTPSFGLALSSDPTGGGARPSVQSPGGQRVALSSPDCWPLAQSLSSRRPPWPPRCAALGSAAALFPPQ